LKAQRDDYDTTYMGEGVKAGDMLWFDGEHFCNRDTVEKLLTQAVSESDGKQLSWLECAKMAAQMIILAEFDKINERYNSKT
ncbi:hypothetical protein KC219_26740, partial [Mycobacterium tuberculosis]|nr:hypothetical protein [Mycobacterium tuberculosis]